MLENQDAAQKRKVGIMRDGAMVLSKLREMNFSFSFFFSRLLSEGIRLEMCIISTTMIVVVYLHGRFGLAKLVKVQFFNYYSVQTYG